MLFGSGNIQDEIFFYTAIIWLPYTLFMWYLFYEHKRHNQYPQYFINLLLAMGCVFRSVWLWTPDYHSYLFSQIVNRFAILFQFSGLCLVMLMWGRAMKASKDLNLNKKNPNANQSYHSATEIGEDLRGIGHQLSIDVAQKNDEKSLAEIYLKRKQMALLIVNIFAYLLVSITVIAFFNNYYAYSVNIISVAVLCLCVDMGIIAVAVKNWYELRSSLAPVFMNSSSRNISSGYKLQWHVIKVVLVVSFIVAVFFGLRAFCFLYGSFLSPEYGTLGINDAAIYPLFFYQFPEFFPNMAIAYGISPPKGVLRVMGSSLLKVLSWKWWFNPQVKRFNSSNTAPTTSTEISPFMLDETDENALYYLSSFAPLIANGAKTDGIIEGVEMESPMDFSNYANVIRDTNEYAPKEAEIDTRVSFNTMQTYY